MAGPSVWIIGNAQDAEFLESVALLRATAEVRPFDMPAAAAEALAKAQPAPDLWVVLNSFAGQFPASELEDLLRLAPLTRAIGVLGAWCEGEPRSGKPWPGMMRVYAGRFPAWWREQLRRLQAGQSSAWSLPLLADAEERLVDAQKHGARGLQLISRILVVARAREAASALSDIFPVPEVQIRRLRPELLPASLAEEAAILWDEFDPRLDLPRLRECLQARPELHVVLLVNFPRWDDRQTLQALGNVSIFAKPFRIEEVRTALAVGVS